MGRRHHRTTPQSRLDRKVAEWLPSLDTLNKLHTLQSLGLWLTKETDVGLKGIRALRQLQTRDLNETEISDIGLADLHGVDCLRLLQLTKTEVTADGVEKRLPHCRRARSNGTAA